MSIATIAPSGGSYTGIVAAEAGEQGDLVTAADGKFLRYTGTWSGADAANVTFGGWTTNSTYFLTWDTDSSNRHTGVWSTSKAHCSVDASTNHVRMQTDYMVIDGVQIQNLRNSSLNNAVLQERVGNYVKSCIVRGRTCVSQTVNATCYSSNNLYYAPASGPALERGFFQDAGTHYTYNNTSYGGNYGFLRNTGTTVAKNCLAYGQATAGFSGTFSGASTNNASGDTSAPGGSPQTSISDPFTNAAGADFSIASGAAVINNGADLSADANLAVSVDILAVTRSSTPTIGAFEFVSAGATSRPGQSLLRYYARAAYPRMAGR